MLGSSAISSKHKLLRCHLGFKIKIKAGRADNYKCRLVVDGTDCTYSFAPVVKHTTLCVYLAIVALQCMHVYLLGADSAFSCAPLHEVVYIYCIYTLPYMSLKVTVSNY